MTWGSDGLLIRGAHVVTSGHCALRDVKIHQRRFVGNLPEVSTTVDAEGLFLTPGFIDLQINGFLGKEFSNGDEGIIFAQQHLPRFGVTSFLPTMGSQPLEKYQPSVLRGAIERAKKREGAEALGWHLEGPFLNQNQCGIHRPSYLLDRLDEPFWKELFQTGSVALMTLAPEIPCTGRLLDILAESDVAVAVGHSMAEEADLAMAKQKGVRFVTHLFNAMPSFHHRLCGIVGAVLGNSMLGFTLICDGYHVYPQAVRMALKCHPEELAIVSDGAPLIGGGDKEGYFLGNPVQVNGERVLTVPEGGLAGSMVCLDEQMRRLMLMTGCPFERAVRCATEVPASFINHSDLKGKIAVGYDADCVLFDADNVCGHIVATFCKGAVAYSRDDFWQRVTLHG